jgi:multidrug efflux pump subunit AcrA (membrane-fusion protein)
MSAEAAPRTARKRKTRWAIGILAAVALIAAGVFAWPLVKRATTTQTATVSTTPVESGELMVTASADGSTEPKTSYDVYPEVGGTVTSVDVAVGDRVKAGDTLFVIDDNSLRDALRQAATSLDQADQQLAQSKQQVAQSKLGLLQAQNKLSALKSKPPSMPASSADIAEAKQGITVAQAGVTSAKAGLSGAQELRSQAAEKYSEAKADLSKGTVTAPADGIVLAVNVSDGSAVSAGGSSSTGGSGGTTGQTGATSGSSAPVVIADTSQLKVTVAVNEADIADVKAGQEATVTFDAIEGVSIPAKVAWVSPNAGASGSVTTYDVELELSAQDKRLRSGMTATADIVTITVADALLVPKSSVKTDGSTKYVTVVSANGGQEKRVVTTGPSDDTRVQIVTGLKAGEQIAAATASSSSTNLRGGAFMMGGGGPPSGAAPRDGGSSQSGTSQGGK